MYLCTQVEITDMRKERETANKYRQQALEGDLMAMNNMGVCYAQGIGVVEESPIMARAEENVLQLASETNMARWLPYG